MAELINPSPSTYLVKTIRGQRRTVIFYDPDIFNEKILISASLLIGEDQTPWDEHYNTVHDENTGVSGTDWKPLEDITIPICPVPQKTDINGEDKIKLANIYDYTVDTNYDLLNEFLYTWEILQGNATIQGSSSDKTVSILFNSEGVVEIKLTIFNTCGCNRITTKKLYPGKFSKKLLVLRNSY